MPMKTRLSAICLTLTATTMISCHEKKTEDAPWILDRFDDIKILRYEVSGFAELPLREKELIYYLAEAAKCGRDIMFDQNFKYNLPVRRTLEVIYENYDGDRTTPEWKALEKYLKKEWYRGHSDLSWHDDHKYGINHDGYWCFESGALVKVLGLDDSSLKGLPYYPYDMVHWNDNIK